MIIETMHQTLEFENELHKQFDGANQKIRNQVQIQDGKVVVEATGDADDIRAKYRKDLQLDEDLQN